MNITCGNCVSVMEKYLCDVPVKWRSDIAKAICLIVPNKDPDCDDMEDCQTLTTLSSFTSTGTKIMITFKDERNKEHHLSIDLVDVINQSLDTIDPLCLATPEEWASMTNKERFEKIMSTQSCNC